MQPYREALQRFHDLSTGDTAAMLAKENALIGLTRLVQCYTENGLDFDSLALFALPDFTFTRNEYRWNAGFSYGCILWLPNQTTPIIPLQFRPNCCGTIVVRTPEWHEDQHHEIFNRLPEVLRSFDGVDYGDFTRSNHFLAVLRDDTSGETYLLFHGSFAAVKEGHQKGVGLYIEKTSYWNDRIRGLSDNQDFKYLIGADAQYYYEVYQAHERFTMSLRERIMAALVPKQDVVFHRVHEGFSTMNIVLLGAYVDTAPFQCPIMLSAEVNLPLINVSRSLGDIAGLPAYRPYYVSPHGGGYMLPNIESAARSDKVRGKGFTLTSKNTHSTYYCSDIINLPYSYRTDVAEIWCRKHGAGAVAQSLRPLTYLK